jgi:hypothetical protein
MFRFVVFHGSFDSCFVLTTLFRAKQHVGFGSFRGFRGFRGRGFRGQRG